MVEPSAGAKAVTVKCGAVTVSAKVFLATELLVEDSPVELVVPEERELESEAGVETGPSEEEAGVEEVGSDEETGVVAVMVEV